MHFERLLTSHWGGGLEDNPQENHQNLTPISCNLAFVSGNFHEFEQGIVWLPPSTWGEAVGGYPQEEFQNIIPISCNLEHSKIIFCDILKSYFPLK